MKPTFVHPDLIERFEQINYLELANELILNKGNDVQEDGVFNIYELTQEAFIFYRLKFDKTNFHHVITRLHRQLRQNGDLLECENPKKLPAKLLELCAFYNNKYYDRVKLFAGYEMAIEKNNSFKSKKKVEQPLSEIVDITPYNKQTNIF